MLEEKFENKDAGNAAENKQKRKPKIHDRVTRNKRPIKKTRAILTFK